MASVPLDQLDGEIWFDGEFVAWKDTKIHVLTHGHYASAEPLMNDYMVYPAAVAAE